MRDYTDITILLDRSGSMASIQEGTIAGLNAFVAEQRAVPGAGCWTLVLFDDQDSAGGAHEPFPQTVLAQVPQEAMPIAVLSNQQFAPRGWTALVDAACLTIDATGSRLAALPEHMRPNRVVMVIVTDGHENHSRRFSKHALAERISIQKSKYNWQFVFLGANMDAIAVGQDYGLRAKSCMTYEYTSGGINMALASASAGTRAWKASGQNEELYIDPQVPAGKTRPGNS